VSGLNHDVQGLVVLPNIAMLASPETASWPRWKVPDSQ
jgi:hypothetical protein